MRLALPAATRNLAIDGFKEDASSAAASRLHTALRVGIAELAIGWGEVALALRENMVFLPLPDGRSQQRRNPPARHVMVDHLQGGDEAQHVEGL